jgi:hypothetical protein
MAALFFTLCQEYVKMAYFRLFSKIFGSKNGKSGGERVNTA